MLIIWCQLHPYIGLERIFISTSSFNTSIPSNLSTNIAKGKSIAAPLKQVNSLVVLVHQYLHGCGMIRHVFIILDTSILQQTPKKYDQIFQKYWAFFGNDNFCAFWTENNYILTCSATCHKTGFAESSYFVAIKLGKRYSTFFFELMLLMSAAVIAPIKLCKRW